MIQGAGGLGVQAAAVAKDMGAATVIVIDQLPGRLELARGFGADHVINVKEITERKDRVALVRKWTGGVGGDVACDFVGFPQVIPEGIEMLRPGGAIFAVPDALTDELVSPVNCALSQVIFGLHEAGLQLAAAS